MVVQQPADDPPRKRVPEPALAARPDHRREPPAVRPPAVLGEARGEGGLGPLDTVRGPAAGAELRERGSLGRAPPRLPRTR